MLVPSVFQTRRERALVGCGQRADLQYDAHRVQRDLLRHQLESMAEPTGRQGTSATGLDSSPDTLCGHQADCRASPCGIHIRWPTRPSFSRTRRTLTLPSGRRTRRERSSERTACDSSSTVSLCTRSPASSSIASADLLRLPSFFRVQRRQRRQGPVRVQAAPPHARRGRSDRWTRDPGSLLGQRGSLPNQGGAALGTCPSLQRDPN